MENSDFFQFPRKPRCNSKKLRWFSDFHLQNTIMIKNDYSSKKKISKKFDFIWEFLLNACQWLDWLAGLADILRNIFLLSKGWSLWHSDSIMEKYGEGAWGGGVPFERGNGGGLGSEELGSWISLIFLPITFFFFFFYCHFLGPFLSFLHWKFALFTMIFTMIFTYFLPFFWPTFFTFFPLNFTFEFFPFGLELLFLTFFFFPSLSLS